MIYLIQHMLLWYIWYNISCYDLFNIWYNLLLWYIWYNMMLWYIWYNMLLWYIWYNMLLLYIWYNMLSWYIRFQSYETKVKKKNCKPQGIWNFSEIFNSRFFFNNYANTNYKRYRFIEWFQWIFGSSSLFISYLPLHWMILDDT